MLLYIYFKVIVITIQSFFKVFSACEDNGCFEDTQLRRPLNLGQIVILGEGSQSLGVSTKYLGILSVLEE